MLYPINTPALNPASEVICENQTGARSKGEPGPAPIAPDKKRKDEVRAVQEDGERKLTEKEKALIKLVRGTGYGEIRITIRDGQPIQVEEVRKFFNL